MQPTCHECKLCFPWRPPQSGCSCWPQSLRLAFDKGQASWEGTVCQWVATLIHQDLPLKSKTHRKQKVWPCNFEPFQFSQNQMDGGGSAVSTLRTWKGTTLSASWGYIYCLLNIAQAVGAWGFLLVWLHCKRVSSGNIFTFVRRSFQIIIKLFFSPHTALLLLSPVSLSVCPHFYFSTSITFLFLEKVVTELKALPC